MGSVHQICLRWNNHQTNFPKVFYDLMKSKDLVDVTLCCEGRKLKAHKLVLSACSPYFQSLFTEVPCKHPVIFFRDVPFSELESIVNYMYKGEVSVAKDSLDQFLKTAESLQVKGLIMETETDQIPAAKETAPSPIKHTLKRPALSEPTPARKKPKEPAWSQSATFTPQPKPHVPANKEISSSSQATFTATTVQMPTVHQPLTPQPYGAGSSSLQSPAAQDDEDDDVIIEPEIKFEAMDHSVNETVNSSITNSAQIGSHQMESGQYITGDDPSDSQFSHADSLADDIDSIMSNINNQTGSANITDMAGLRTSSLDPQSEDYFTPPRTVRTFISSEMRTRIIAAVESRRSQRDIAETFGISRKSIWRIMKERNNENCDGNRTGLPNEQNMNSQNFRS